MGRASRSLLLGLVGVVLLAGSACPAPKKVVDSGVAAAPKPPPLPQPTAPDDALPPSKGAEIPPGGTCITVEAASSVALFSSGRDHDCPRRLDRTMSGEKDWPRVFQTLGVVALNNAGTQRAQAERKDGACCYDVRAPRPEDAPK